MTELRQPDAMPDFAERAVRPERRSVAVPAAPVARGLDGATVIGLASAVALFAAAVWLGGAPGAFIDLPSILIVLGGTAAVTMISFTLDEVARVQGLLLKALWREARDPAAAALQALKLAETARQKGPLQLQVSLPALDREPFLKRAISLAVDGAPTDEIERTMSEELRATGERHARGIAILNRAAEVAPAMGLIGTLVGLVQMLGNLDDPGSIGPSMSVALLTTLYGALLANIVLAPLASKLERNAEAERLIHQIYTLAAISIGRQDNPRRLELLLNAILPPAQRVRYFD